MSRLIDRVAAVPGVDSATAVAGGTLVGLGGVNGLQVDGFTPRDAQDQRARADWVGPDYFRTAGVRLVAGREFSSRDEANAPGVAVVNETAARFYFGNAAAAVGRRFVFNKRDYAIVGVSEDAKYASLRDSTPRLIYFAQLQNGSPNALEIRTTTTDAASVIAAVRAAVREVDPQLSPGEVLSASERIDRTLGRERLLANLSSAFGVLTLLLVSTRVYGTLGYAVNRRTREIGVRIALGAGCLSVIGLVFRELAAVVIAGALAGRGAERARRAARAVAAVRPHAGGCADADDLDWPAARRRARRRRAASLACVEARCRRGPASVAAFELSPDSLRKRRCSGSSLGPVVFGDSVAQALRGGVGEDALHIGNG